MARSEDVVWVQLATRIPKSLHRVLRLHCVTTETSVMEFVTKAIQEKLARPGSRPAKRRGTKT
jgi:predicted HicB family RNase H-like nuclease